VIFVYLLRFPFVQSFGIGNHSRNGAEFPSFFLRLTLAVFLVESPLRHVAGIRKLTPRKCRTFKTRYR